jgi:hypothetical protein
LSESSVKDLQEVKATESAEVLQTPQTNSRTLPSFQDELFSPGSFFASRSGNLGKLGGPGNIDRVFSDLYSQCGILLSWIPREG